MLVSNEFCREQPLSHASRASSPERGGGPLAVEGFPVACIFNPAAKRQKGQKSIAAEGREAIPGPQSICIIPSTCLGHILY